MLLKQSLTVDTTKLKDSFDYISHDVTMLKDYLRSHPKSLYCTPQLLDEENPKSIMVLRMKNKKRDVLMTMINPMIMNIKDTIAVEETQDQVEGTYINIRHPQLHIAYLALPGVTPTEVTLTGKSALIFQQALRLMQGISIDIFGLRIDNYEEYQKGTEEERQQIIGDYIRALKEVSEESLQDEDTQEYVKAVEFMAENAQASISKEFNDQCVDATEEILAAAAKVKAEEEAKKKKDENN